MQADHRGLGLSCPLCKVRKEKRFCLALHGRICAQCCGEQREVTLDCPSECPYLQQARQYEKRGPQQVPPLDLLGRKPREARENPPEEMFPAIQLNREFLDRNERFIAGVLSALGRASRADRDLRDREVIAAVSNLVRSRQTLITSGLIYQEPLPSPAQQAIIAVLEELTEEFRKVEEQEKGYSSLKDRDVLGALVFVLRLAHLHTSGRPLARGFIDFLRETFPEPGARLDLAAEAGNRIILP